MARFARLMLGVAVILAAIVSGLYIWLMRLRPLRGVAAPKPATSYTDALRQLALLQADEADAVNPVCLTTLLTHGSATARVIVLFHGFTNCPQQFRQLAEEFFARGYNVLTIRLPRHGMADRLTTELAQLTAEEMVALANRAVDIARGLGEHVTVMGLSLGGALAGWIAHHRPDVARTVMVSPALAIQAIPVSRQRLYMNLLALLPNSFRWWDPVNEAERIGPAHAYPRFATRGLGALLHLGALVQAEAKQRRPECQRVIVITNPCDDVVDNAATAATVAGWRSHGGHVTTHAFPADWALIHDLIDPAQVDQQVAKVYPQLLMWIDG